MTPIEIIALILIIVSAIKIVVLLVNPGTWMGFARKVWSNPSLAKVVSFVLAGVVLYYLLQELSIVQIFAVIGFTALLLVIGLASDIGYFVKKYETLVKKGSLWKEYWFYTLIWIVLIGWAAKELFM